ncbi:hypothetical protein C0J52_08184 [Blattella germanica]|nr:hypothetical protein C0J52_08184 [Blattella germanica]
MKVFHFVLIFLVPFGLTSACPQKCTCSRTKIFCKYTAMKTMPPISPTTTSLSVNGDIVNPLNRSFITQAAQDLITLKLINMKIQEIQPFTFYRMGKLQSLTISQNNIKYLQSNVFIGLDKLQILDLSRNSFSTLNSSIFEGLSALRHLNLSHNYNYAIHSVFFNGLRHHSNCKDNTTSRTLDLSGYNNAITYLDEGVFEGLCLFTKLETINIRLTTKPIPGIVFQGLSALRKLAIVGGNHWPAYTATGDTMRGLYSLTHLTIRDSFFPKVPNRFFQDLTLLRILNLGSNRINELESGCFFGLNNLSELQLNDNRINSLNNSVFEHLISLTKLNLSYNEINTIHENAFNGLHRLRFLDLSNNWFTALGGSRFVHLPFLKELDISNNDLVMSNQVETIDTKAFSGLFSLKKLHVPLNAEKNITDVKLSSLQRVDYFQGPVYFVTDGVNIMKTFDLIESGGLKSEHLDNWLNRIVCVKNIFNLEVRNLNSIQQLKDLSKFHITNLNIVDANISVLERDSFNGFDQLKSLKIDVPYSEITLKRGVFDKLDKLENLELTFYKFNLEPGIFRELFYLRKLFFKKYSLNTQNALILTPGIFNGLQNLKELTLVDVFKTVGGSSFFGLENLDILDINANFISNLEQGSFHGLRNIRELHLKNNYLSTIGPGIFGALCDEKFKLTCANLTKISKFCNVSFVLQSLETLDLSDNKITFIHQHAFLGCSKLHTLTLSLNKIQILDFFYLPQLGKLEF